MFNITKATLDDLPQCLICAEKFVTLYGFKWDEKSAVNALTYIINNGTFIIAKQDSKVIGGAAALVSPNLWNVSETMYQEMFWWVEEEYRSGSLGIRLLQTLEAQAPVGSTIVLSILPTSNIKDETLNKLGYKLREKAYIKQ